MGNFTSLGSLDHYQKPQTDRIDTKYWLWPQNHVSSLLRSSATPRVRILLLEVLLDLLQPLHPVLDLQVTLRLLKMVQNDSPTTKHWF